ncbi:MAG: cytochrome c biogenesis protein CcdA [Sphingomonadales bacterium]|nr:cytochrome c biogenesis protein CcdA [Sphingomonadales bacterium]
MADLSTFGIAVAFVAGTISFLSPCVLPLVPAYVSYIAGGSIADSERQIGSRLIAASLSLCFVLGFSTVFVLLGASATALGQLLSRYRYELNILAGALVILFGVFMLGRLNLPWLQRDWRFHGIGRSGRPAAAYVLGLAFGFGWSPCIGPVLGGILTFAAAQANVTEGVALLAIYSLGLGVPFILAALFTEGLVARIKAVGHAGRVLRVVTGAIMIVMGLAMITGQLSAFSYWLLETMPALGRIG